MLVMRSILLVTLLLTGPATAAPVAEPRPPSVTVIAAKRGPIAETAVLTGSLVAREEVLVSPQLDGLAIIEILAEEGDHVDAGQVLARLSRDVLDASVAQNTAQLVRTEAAIGQARNLITEAQATRQQAELAFNRTRELVTGGNASRETLEQRQAIASATSARVDSAGNALRVAEADRALALAQRQELLVRLARTELRAPVAGLVSRRTARTGAVVSGGGDALFRIIEGGSIELEADVPEVLLARLRANQPAAIETVGGTRAGVVRLVSSEVSRTTRLGRVRVAVEGDGLVIGSFARARVETARRDGILVPLSAVLFQADGSIVQVVRDGLVDSRRVVTGLRNQSQVEVSDGVAEGEAVVSVSGTFIRAGDRVVAISGTK